MRIYFRIAKIVIVLEGFIEIYVLNRPEFVGDYQLKLG